MDAAPRRSRSELRGWIGAGVGICGAALGTILVTAATGNWQALLTVGLPFLVLSFGLWQLLVLAAVGMRRTFGPQSRESALTMFGCLLTGGGILLLVATGLVMPTLLEDPGIRRLLSATGSVTQLPTWQGWLALTIGSGLLAWPVWRLLTPRTE